jgi:hypothetical protein
MAFYVTLIALASAVSVN